MKKALFVLAAIAMGSSAFADGQIQFANRTITKDGGGSYDVPIWQYNGGAQGNVGAGSLAGGVTVGLFFNGNQVAQSVLRSTSSQQFFGTPSSQAATIPGVQPGTTQTLVVREWQGSSFDAAKAGGGQWGEQTFTSKPLGGTDTQGNIFLVPTMTGWTDQSGNGVTLNPVPEPTTIAFGAIGIGALLLRRRK